MKIILGVYFVVQILILSFLMTLQIDLIPHSMVMALACIAYLLVAFKKPGYYSTDKESLSLSDQINCNRQIDTKVIKEIDEEDQCDENSLKNCPGQQLKVDSKIICQMQSQIQERALQTQKNQQKIERRMLKSKFADFNYKKQIRLKDIKGAQIDFIINKSSNQTLRYCRICKVFQPYRVRHCHQCEKCICTFDHHCPWMNNCIGQKNRHFFWFYLVIQFTQFVLVLVAVFKKTLNQQNIKRTCFLCGSVFLVTLMSLILLNFHTYLMVKNFTTWQYVRWDKISYLSMYKYKKSSPFSHGFINNLRDYFSSAIQISPRQWTINPNFIQMNRCCDTRMKQLNKNKQEAKMQANLIQKTQTQRAMTAL